MNERQLIELKEQINEAKAKVEQLNGRKTYLMEKLEKDYKCKSVQQATRQLEELRSKATKLDQQIQKSMAEIEKELA